MDTNVTGTLNLLEEAVAAGVGRFVFTSTTSAFGRALTPPPGAPAAWITEDVAPVPRNIYGVTKTAAEDLCELVHRDHGLPCLILRTSRFFPEADDRDDVRARYDDANLKVNELLYRRVDLEDVVSAHRLALERAPRDRVRALHRQRHHAVHARRPRRAARRRPGRRAAAVPATTRRSYERRGWRMFPSLERVYVNERARSELGWEPRYDFRAALDRLDRAGTTACARRHRRREGLPRGVDDDRVRDGMISSTGRSASERVLAKRLEGSRLIDADGADRAAALVEHVTAKSSAPSGASTSSSSRLHAGRPLDTLGATSSDGAQACT